VLPPETTNLAKCELQILLVMGNGNHRNQPELKWCLREAACGYASFLLIRACAAFAGPLHYIATAMTANTSEICATLRQPAPRTYCATLQRLNGHMRIDLFTFTPCCSARFHP
jgi:hypothetical protein